MAIAQMNTFFSRHHRIIFGVITVIIIIAFTDFLTPGTGIVDAFSGRSRGSTAGEIFGRKITYAALNEQVMYDMLAAQVFMGIPINDSMRDRMMNQSFYTLAGLAAAERAGLQVSNAEVGQFLRLFFRNEAGQFSEELYRNFVEGFLTAQGFSEEALNTAARQYLLLTKLQEMQRAAIITTPGELETFRRMIAEEFEVMAGKFTAADFAAAVKVEPAALEEFFQNNRARYIIPATIQATVASMPYENFRAEAAKRATPEAVKLFYDNNPALFSKIADGKTEVKPFDQVKKEAALQATAAIARDLALTQANQFVGAAYEAISNAKPEARAALFARLAGEHKFTLRPTGPFKSTDKTAGAVAEPLLVGELAGVFADIPVTNAVAGEKGVYVGYVTEMDPSREAELAEVQADVTRDYVQSKALEAARTRAAEVSTALQALPPEGRLARVKSSANPKFQMLPKFTRMKNTADGLPPYMLDQVMNLLPGAISQPMPTPDGAIVVQMIKRSVPARSATAEPMLEVMFRNYKLALAQAEFQAYLNANCTLYRNPSEAEGEE